MVIELKDFGPISYLKFDLDKDLHMIYGENAIGKSYATYLMYCFIKNIKNKRVYNQYYSLKSRETPAIELFVRDQLTKIKKSKNKKIDVTGDYLELVRSELEALLVTNIQNSLLNSFSSLKNLNNRYTNNNYEIVISITRNTQLSFKSDVNGSLRMQMNTDVKRLEFYLKNTKSTKFSFYHNKKMLFGVAQEEEFIRRMRSTHVSTVNSLLDKLDNKARDIYYLPASRSGLYQALNAFTPIVAELTQNRFFMQNRNIELPSLPEPLSDYFIDLSTVSKKNQNGEFDELIDFIQKNILKGEVYYNENSKKIYYKPTNIDIELELSESSSMVSELSPIVIYLKHIINHKYGATRSHDPLFYDPFYDSGNNNKTKDYDIIFIEEPEAHLHPEVQVLMMKVFTKLIKGKMKVFITSHSNYMFNKLNNIILKKEVDVNKVAVYHLVHSINGTVKDENMSVTDEGIMDENFRDTSEKLYQERMESYK